MGLLLMMNWGGFGVGDVEAEVLFLPLLLSLKNEDPSSDLTDRLSSLLTIHKNTDFLTEWIYII